MKNSSSHFGIMMMSLSLAFIMQVSADIAISAHHKAIASGTSHSLIVKADGNVWVAGGGNSRNFEQATGVSDVIAVTASGCSFALKADGTVWSRTSGTAEFLQLPPTDVKGFGCGTGHSFVVKTDGSLWGTGSHFRGCLGLGDDAEDPGDSWVEVPGISDVEAVDAGAHHSVALKTDGTVWATGWNDVGELGDGTRTTSNVFIQSQDSSEGFITDVIAIVVGYNHNLVIKRDGTVWGIGAGSYGRLGNGVSSDQYRYVEIPGISDVKSVGAGSDWSVVLKNDGTVWAAGRNNYGVIGDGTNEDRPLFVQSTTISGDVQEIAASGNTGHTVALKQDGTVWVVGWNEYGQLGDGTNTHKNTYQEAMTDVNTAIGVVPPKEDLSGGFVFRNDPDQRAICRQITTATACNAERLCSWNVFQALCNEHGYQPLFEGCQECRYEATTTTTTISPDTFADNDFSGWNCGAITICNGLGGVGICGGYGVKGINTDITKTFEVNAGRYQVQLDFISIDSWDGEYGYVSLNGAQCWSHVFTHGSGTDVCGSGTIDRVETVTCSTTVSGDGKQPLTVRIWTSIDQDPNDESFGVNNVVVTRLSPLEGCDGSLQDFDYSGSSCEAHATAYNTGVGCDVEVGHLHWDGWFHSNGDHGYFQVQAPSAVAMVGFSLGVARGPAYSIQYSDDGSNFQTATAISTSTADSSTTWDCVGQHIYWRYQLDGDWGGGPWYHNLQWQYLA